MIIALLLSVFILYCPSVHAWDGEVWPDQPHPSVDYFSLTAGGGYSYHMPSGYSHLENNNAHAFILTAQLYASKKIPVFSKLKWQSTTNFNLSEDPVIAGHEKPAGYDGFVELRMPFTTTFLSRDTSWFVQYERKVTRFSAELSDETYYGNGMTFQKGDDLTFGKQSQRLAVAIDTPITGEDSPDSYSRFGLYYAQDIRPRSATRPDETVSDGWLLKVIERQGGIFYDINKPAFVQGLILHLYLSAGFGQQGVLSNNYGITDTEFKASKTLLFTEVEAGVAYRIPVTAWMGVKADVKYAYSGIMSLVRASSSTSKFNNNAEQMFQGGLSVNFIF